MTRVLFLQHGPLDLPGLWATVLAERGVAVETRHVAEGDPIPTTLDGYAGLGIGGGAQSAYEEAEHPWLRAEKALVRQARERQIPTLGMCLGAQVMASALGAEVRPNAQKEIGFFPVEFTPAAADDPLFRDLPAPFVPAHWHGDTFALPPGAVALASSALTPHQLFRCDDHLWGLQFHLEMTAPILQAMAAEDGPYLTSAGVDPVALSGAAPEHFAAVEGTARTVFTRWAALLP